MSTDTKVSEMKIVNAHGLKLGLVDNAEFINLLMQVKGDIQAIAFDLETTGIDPVEPSKINRKLVAPEILSIAAAALLPGEQALRIATLRPDNQTLREFVDLLDDVPVSIAHNASFEHAWLKRFTGKAPRITDDTLEMARVSWAVANSKGEFALEPIVRLKELVKHLFSIDYGIDVSGAQVAQANDDPESLLIYNALDAGFTLKLFIQLNKHYSHNLNAYTNATRTLGPVLDKLNNGLGFYADKAKILSNVAAIKGEVEVIKAEIARYCPQGKLVNIASTKQLANVLFDHLGLQPVGRTKTGAPSTSKEALSEMSRTHPICGQILRYRELTKLVQFSDKYAAQDEIEAGYVSVPSEYRMKTVTGRLTCSNENIQQIPRDGRVRGVFCSAPGKTLLVADFSQVELRLAAIVSGDANMSSAYLRGADLHTLMASQMTGKPEVEVTKSERTAAKAANFGLLYGMGAQGFVGYARQNYEVELSLREAEKVKRTYFATFPGLAKLHNKTRSDLRASKKNLEYYQIISASGRRRLFPSAAKFEGVFRESINFIIQSLAADVMYRTLIDLDSQIPSIPGMRLVATIHDSLIVEVPDNAVEEASVMVKQIMENPMILAPLGLPQLPIPMVADIEVGRYWG